MQHDKADSKRVVLVHNEPELLALIEAVLDQQFEVEPQCFSDCELAWDVIKHSSVDLVITGDVMSAKVGGNGRELVTRLKASPTFPVIILTGQTEVAWIKEAVEMFPHTHCFELPVEHDALISVASKYLKKFSGLL